MLGHFLTLESLKALVMPCLAWPLSPQKMVHFLFPILCNPGPVGSNSYTNCSRPLTPPPLALVAQASIQILLLFLISQEDPLDNSRCSNNNTIILLCLLTQLTTPPLEPPLLVVSTDSIINNNHNPHNNHNNNKSSTINCKFKYPKPVPWSYQTQNHKHPDQEKGK